MNKIQLFLSLLLLAVFASCTTDVDLYADYKDIPVVYGLMDATQDTNYVRINRAFSSSNDHPINANEVALIADSCNYPGKLEAYIVEYKSGFGNSYQPTGSVFTLDTLTIHDKDTGVFYAPHQKVYYTTGRFKENAGNTHYKYRLFIHKGNDTITSETGIVGGDEFRILTTQAVFMAAPSVNPSKITFKPAENAVFYNVKMVFNYKEKHGMELVNKQVWWNFGTKSTDELAYEDGHYSVSYGMNSLFNLMADAIGGDTIGVIRYFDPKPIDIMIAAGGEELYNYIQVNSQAGGLSQSVPDYTNISGGYGVFSSRINLVKTIALSSQAMADLYGKPWGFSQR